MLKKILTYSGITILTAMVAAYFYFASSLYAKKSMESVCTGVEVEILDSASNKFVSKEEVIGIIDGFNGKSIGSKCRDINLDNIELLLNRRSAIKESQASLTRDGIMRIEITQRRPILRIETSGGGFYIDEFEYIFPLVESFTSYVPIVTGHIPLELDSEYRGEAGQEEMPWITKMSEFGKFLNEKVSSPDEALAGARDIIAEKLNETASVRETVRRMLRERRLVSKTTRKADSPEAAKFRGYFGFSESLSRIASHRLLAVLRAEDEGYLNLHLDADPEKCGNKLYYDYCHDKKYPNAETSSGTVYLERGHKGGKREGRYRIHQGFRRESAPASPCSSGRTEKGHGH